MDKSSSYCHSTSFIKHQLCCEFRDCDDAEVLEALTNHDEKKWLDEKTITFIVTFGLSSPPNSIRSGYMKLNVGLYVSNHL